MARQVSWAETALGDLQNVANFIATDSRYYAAAFVREVRDAARSLKNLAERGRVVPEFKDPNVRELFVRNYRLIYNLTERNVSILAFIHGSRDLAMMWKRESRPTE